MLERLIGGARFVGAYLTLVVKPRALERVFEIGRTLPDDESERILRVVPGAPRVMDAPPLADLPDRDALRAMPEGSLGRAYVELLDRDGLNPEDLDYAAGTTPIDRFRRHTRLTHDLWHTVTGFSTDTIGELGLQAFTLAQWANPLPLVLLSAGLLHTAIFQRDDAHATGKVIAEGFLLGDRARTLLEVDWHALLEQPLEEVRRELRIAPA